ncbi:ee36d6cc-605c-4bac-8edc-e434aa738015 [Sclerotinia trifoliorum]|uniref:Ee36d6cc-605c-4bac-8edc-e434aa738015 n=1 Tax=Sclerotinia trifoliorum TaxID=28548 RepID=A0A8H2ZPF9_9HELO|nr:ee36d6cc-605c-4bac-8edc-e434aa738015 [Sclerotinia trifoliorum]
MSSPTSENPMSIIPTTENEKPGDIILQPALEAGEEMSGVEMLVVDEATLQQKEGGIMGEKDTSIVADTAQQVESDDSADGASKQSELGNISPNPESAVSGDTEEGGTMTEVNVAHLDVVLEVDGSIMDGGEKSVDTDAFTEQEPRRVVCGSEMLEGTLEGAVPSLEGERTVFEANAMAKLEEGQTMGGCGTLETLSPEVRRMIWKLLLSNPKLGKVQPGYEGEISREVYDLWPRALQTCRQIYAEASEVLYGSNTFFFVCKYSSCQRREQEGTGAIPAIPVPAYKISEGIWKSLLEIVQALRILRNIGASRFSNAKAADCPEFHICHEYEIKYRVMDDTLKTDLYNPIPLSLQAELRSLCLLNYAQTYERYKPYRDGMGINRTRYEETLHRLSLFNRYFPRETYDKNRLPREFWLSPCWSYHDSSGRHEAHPVESGLGDCNQAVDDNDATAFKAKRRLVLQYLERQYRRVVKASRDVHRFIYIQKVSYGLLDINREMKFIESSPERNHDRKYRDTMIERYAAKGCVLLEA